MAKLKYSDEELINLYRGAADKNKQIEILADMRVCKPEEIIQMLADAGEIPGMRGKVKGKKKEGRSDGHGVPTPHPSPAVTPSPQGEGLKKPSLEDCQSQKGFAIEEEEQRNGEELSSKRGSEAECSLCRRQGEGLKKPSLSGEAKGKKMKVPRWTSEELEKLQEYIDEGMSYAEIADRFGKNLQSIYDAVSKHKLRGKNWQIQNVLPGEKKMQNEEIPITGTVMNRSLRNDNLPLAESEDIKLMEKCVDAAEKRVIQLSNAIADAGAAAKILHDLIRIAGSGIEDMCEDPVGVYQMMFCTMEDVIKDIRKNLIETGEEYDG